MNVDAAIDYVCFVGERHHAWRARQAGFSQDTWTTDPIIRSRKFTNVFRILDPGTQLVMRGGFLDGDPADVLMRCFLYRHTGRFQAWDWLVRELAAQPTRDDLDDVLEALQDYRAGGGSVFTGAYMVYPQSAVKGTDKLTSVVGLTRRLFVENGSTVATDFQMHLEDGRPERAFKVLRANKGVADFMSMQILTDYGYGPGELDDTFAVCGPGALRGAAALGLTGPQALEWAATAVPPSVYLELPDGRHRAPSAMDLQNTLCEFSKYVRYLDRPRADKPYRPAHPGAQPAPVLPRHW